VKFLLATTDPQKLPVTVLSRCLQFNLKRLPASLILKRLDEIMRAEQIEAEPEALRLVAKSAEGSMRDALSLLDQVIAFGGARLTTVDTRSMLGTVDRSQIQGVLEALVARDARGLLEQVRIMDEHVPDYRDALGELAGLLQRLAVLQAVPDWEAADEEDVEVVKTFAARVGPEDVQLWYQIALAGRRDLELAPEPRAGFEMTLLRMLAFQPAGVVQPAASGPVASTPARAAAEPVQKQPPASGSDWSALVAQLNLQGMVSQLAAHCTWGGRSGNRIRLLLDADGEPFRRPALEEKLAQALSAHFGEAVRIEFELAVALADTPARRRQTEAEDRLQNAKRSIEDDPNVRAMQDIFGATVQPESVKPL
jgi:DNA polymerase-3 subunit gamma/tau